MDFTFLKLDVADRVATVTIDRQDKLNALNRETLEALDSAFLAAGQEEGLQHWHHCSPLCTRRARQS